MCGDTAATGAPVEDDGRDGKGESGLDTAECTSSVLLDPGKVGWGCTRRRELFHKWNARRTRSGGGAYFTETWEPSVVTSRRDCVDV